jgi:predicted fused transcriptional regulator/phosphomethylpyrimidine kinase/predicted transcriptional regulator
MRTPCETVVKEYLPMLRAMIADKLLKEYGWTQRRTSEALGLTQPAISGYLRTLEAREGPSTGLDLKEIEDLAEGLAEALAHGGVPSAKVVEEVCRFCLSSRLGGSICSLHKARVPMLSAEKCTACMNLYSLRSHPLDERGLTLKRLSEALALIEESKDFLRVIPEVGSNLVEAIGEAESISDVAGVPGRITIARDRVRLLTPPEFGASKNTAAILLAVKRLIPSMRGAISIAYRKEIKEAVEKLSYKILKVDLSRVDLSDPSHILNLSEELRVQMEPMHTIDGILEEGGAAREPILYLLGVDSREAVEKALKVAELLKTADNE